MLYGKLTHGNELRSHPDLRNPAMAMRRTTAALLMRKANFDSLDPAVPGSALSNAAQLTRAVWNDYERNPVGIMTEAHRAYLKVLGTGS